MSIGFYQPKQMNRRAIYSPGTGRKLGYFCNDSKGNQLVQDPSGRTTMRIIRWRDGRNPYTDAHLCGGSWPPPSYLDPRISD